MRPWESPIHSDRIGNSIQPRAKLVSKCSLFFSSCFWSWESVWDILLWAGSWSIILFVPRSGQAAGDRTPVSWFGLSHQVNSMNFQKRQIQVYYYIPQWEWFFFLFHSIYWVGHIHNQWIASSGPRFHLLQVIEYNLLFPWDRLINSGFISFLKALLPRSDLPGFKASLHYPTSYASLLDILRFSQAGNKGIWNIGINYWTVLHSTPLPWTWLASLSSTFPSRAKY